MRHLKHPATIIALIALFAAVSGGAGAAVTTLISGSQIKNNSIPLNRLEGSAIKSLQVHGMARSNGGGSTCPLNTTDQTPTFCGKPATFTFDRKTGALVTVNLDLASGNGSEVFGRIGVCYAEHGSTTLTDAGHVYPDFVAPSGSYFAQGVSATIGGLKGTYDLGLCVYEESSNALNGHYAVTSVVAETSVGVKKLGPMPN